MARPSKRKPLARVKRDSKQSWEEAFLGGREKSSPKHKALADEDLKILKSSNENRGILNYSRGRRGN